MPLKSDYNHIICIMEGETKNIRFVLKIYRFVLRLLNISFCGLYSQSGNTIQISAQGQHKGIYILRISDGKQSHVQKVVVK